MQSNSESPLAERRLENGENGEWHIIRERLLSYQNSKREQRDTGRLIVRCVKLITDAVYRSCTIIANSLFGGALTTLIDLFFKNQGEEMGIREVQFDSTGLDQTYADFQRAWFKYDNAVKSYEVKIHMAQTAYRLYFIGVFNNLINNHGMNIRKLSKSFGMHQGTITNWIENEDEWQAKFEEYLQEDQALKDEVGE